MASISGELLGGRYDLGQIIGEGGAAVVYHGLDVRLQRAVAVKVLRSGLTTDSEALARFRREAQAAASLVHPNVVAVYDYGESGDLYYIILELLPGPSLREFLRAKGALSTGRAVTIAGQILAGLQAAHARGIIHRDVKPQNILFGEDGAVKVADFGIARALSAPALTTFGEAIGTAHYLSPEQARGEPAGPPSDVYSTGVVLYEMLAGAPPFDGDTNLALALKHISADPPLLATVAPHVPPALSAVVHRALAKDPSQRFANAGEFAVALANLNRTAEQRTTVFAAARPSPLEATTVIPTQAGAGAPRPRPPIDATTAFDPALAPRPAPAVTPPLTSRSGDAPRRSPASGLLKLFFWTFLLTFGIGVALILSDRSAAFQSIAGLVAGALPASSPTSRVTALPTFAPIGIVTGTPTRAPAVQTTPSARAATTPTARTAATTTAAPATPTPRPTVTPTPVPPTATPTRTLSRVAIDVGAFAGACRLDGPLKALVPVDVALLFGGRSDCSRATATFELTAKSFADAVLVLNGAASPTDLPDVEVLLNGKTVFAGRSPFESDRSLGEVRWQLPDGALRPGANTVEVRNREKNGRPNQPPWIGLAGAGVEFR